MVEPIAISGKDDEMQKRRAHQDALFLRSALAAALPYAEQIKNWTYRWSDHHGCLEVGFDWRDAELFCQFDADKCQDISVTGQNSAAAILMQQLLQKHFVAMTRAILVE